MIFLILFLALILRLVNLNQSLWLDEAVQAITAKASFSSIFQEIIGDFHPPLYHVLMHFWVRIFGTSEISLRMPSVLFGVGTVWFVYKIFKVISNKKLTADNQPLIINRWSWATVAALFMATAPLHIYYSQEARMYSMVTFLVTGGMYYFIKIISNKKPTTDNQPLVIGYFFFMILAIYTDYFAFLVLAVQMLILFLQKKYRYLFICLFVFLLIYLPWLPMFIKQIKFGITATAVLPEWGRLVNLSFLKALPLTFIKFSIGRITIFNKKVYLLVALAIFGGLGILGAKIIRKARKSEEERIISLWFLIPLLSAWGISLFVPNFQPFRLLLILPAFYMLISLGIESFDKDIYFNKFQSKSGITRGILIAIVLGVNLVSLSVYFLNPYFQREDWRGVVKYLDKQINAVIILPSETSSWPIKYYDQTSKLNLLYASQGVKEVSGNELAVIGDQLSAFSNSEKIFYIRYLVPLFDPGEKISEELKNGQYSKIKEVSFNQIQVLEYKK